MAGRFLIPEIAIEIEVQVKTPGRGTENALVDSQGLREAGQSQGKSRGDDYQRGQDTDSPAVAEKRRYRTRLTHAGTSMVLREHVRNTSTGSAIREARQWRASGCPRHSARSISCCPRVGRQGVAQCNLRRPRPEPRDLNTQDNPDLSMFNSSPVLKNP